MSMTVETAKLPTLPSALRLPTFGRLWPQFCDRADKEGWPAERLLAALCELELSEREQRRIQRHLAAARLPHGKTLDTFDFSIVPTVSQARVRALVEGDSWLQAGHNLLAFGPPGAGKSHLASGIGYELIQRGYRVQMARTSDLVQRLQNVRQDLALTQEIARLDKFDLSGMGLGPMAASCRTPRRSLLRQEGSGRDQCAVRVGRCPIRASFDHDHRQPAVQRMGGHLPRQGHDRRHHRSARSPRHHLREPFIAAPSVQARWTAVTATDAALPTPQRHRSATPKVKATTKPANKREARSQRHRRTTSTNDIET